MMTHELLQDLAMYKTHRDRGVAMAARSLIQLFRTVNPDLLHKKDRVSGWGYTGGLGCNSISHGGAHCLNVCNVQCHLAYDTLKLTLVCHCNDLECL